MLIYITLQRFVHKEKDMSILNSIKSLSAYFSDSYVVEQTDEYTIENKIIFNRKTNANKEYKVKFYKNSNFKHRYEGPAILIYDINTDELLEVTFCHNNKLVPDWVPKVSEFGVSHELNNGIILKVALKYDTNYASFLKTYYETANKEITAAKKILSDMIFELINYKKCSNIDYIINDVYQLIKPENVNIDVAKKLIKEVILGMAIDNIIEYNEDSNLIKIKEKDNGI